MSKRSIFLAMLLVLVMSSLVFAGGTLNVLIWPGYHNPELIKTFESKHSVKVNIIEVDTYDKMLDYLTNNPGKVDLLIFGEFIVPELIKTGKLQPLNKNLIPNIKNADPLFLNLPYDLGNKYTVPYHYLFIGLAYNKEKISYKEATLGNYFEGPGKFSGRIVTYPDARLNMGFAMKYMGKSFNNMNKADIELVKVLLKQLKKNAIPESGRLDRGIYDGLIALNQGKADITIYYYENPSNVTYIEGGLKPYVEFKIPEEGALIGTDTMSIPKGAQNVDNAYKFIDFMYDPVNAAKSVNYLGNPFPVLGLADKLDPALAKRIILPNDLLKKCECANPLKTGESDFYSKIWEEIFN